MRLRQLVLACGLTSFVLSPYASALGLGEVKLKSTLNQPLEAEVKLLDTRDLTAEQILVSLASPADFERNGVGRLFFYTEFQFQVDLTSADGPKVIIRSRNPVREPYLNFLIEARWTAGRLLREYTVLMDLPTFDEGSSTKAVQTAVTRSAQQPTATRSSATGNSNRYESANPAQSGRRATLSGDEYEVRSNDTLWEIALRARADSGISVHQSMMALYRANPEAFISGNINRLRRGQVLRIPDAAEMKSLARSEAVSQFAQATGDSNFGAQLNASRRASTTRADSAEASGRVKLAAPSSGASGAGQGSGANNGAGKALESELAVTLEELDKSKAENTELSSRVRDLEAQIDTMERLVDVSNEKLRALQVAAVQSTDDEPAVPPNQAATPEVAAVAATSAGSSVAAAIAQPPLPTAPKKTVILPPASPTFADTAIDNAPWIGLGILGLAGAGFFAYRRRKQTNEQGFDEQDDIFSMDDTVDDQEVPADVVEQFDQLDEPSLFEEESDEAAVAETGDVVGEADIYIAYGKLDQAEEMLVNALQKDPESTDIRMKLLEVYAQQENVPAFDKHYAILLPLAGAALLSRASDLREGMPGVGEFEKESTLAASSVEDEFLLDDFDFNEEAELESGAVSTPAIEDSGFDFDLDLDDDSDELAALGDKLTSAGEESIDEFALDLDGDLVVASEADDLSELSLALDELKVDSLPTDVEAASSLIEDEFNFNLDDDLDLGELSEVEEDELALTVAPAPVQQVPEESTESLDVLADDFNLDMDVDDIDLAALDHEMESLDVDFAEDFLADDASIEALSLELGSDEQNEFELTEIDSSALLADDLSAANLSLTDDLDKLDEELSFDLEEEFSSAALDDQIKEVIAESSEESAIDFNLEEDLDFSSLESAPELELSEADLLEIPVDEQNTADEAPTEGLASIIEESAGVEDILLAGEAVQDQEALDEDLFTQALSDFSNEDDIDLNEFSSDEVVLADLSEDDMDAELDFLADADEAATKLDLARAYIDMGDVEGAKDILSEVLGEGNDNQRTEANELLARIG